MNTRSKRLTTLLQAKYRKDPRGFNKYLPGVAELLPERSRGRSRTRSPFGLTKQELLYHETGLTEALDRLQEDVSDSKAAVKGLQHCAALIKDDNLPDEVGYEALKCFIRAAIGKSPTSYRSKKTVPLGGDGSLPYERVSAIRGVYLDLDRNSRLVSVTINPGKVRERRKLLELVGIGEDDKTDVASRHDDYLAEQEPHGVA